MTRNSSNNEISCPWTGIDCQRAAILLLLITSAVVVLFYSFYTESNIISEYFTLRSLNGVMTTSQRTNFIVCIEPSQYIIAVVNFDAENWDGFYIHFIVHGSDIMTQRNF